MIDLDEYLALQRQLILDKFAENPDVDAISLPLLVRKHPSRKGTLHENVVVRRPTPKDDRFKDVRKMTGWGEHY